MLGDDIRVTVLGVKGNQVRVGIEAPKATSVMREELLARDRNQTTTPVHQTPIPAA